MSLINPLVVLEGSFSGEGARHFTTEEMLQDV